MDTESPTKPRLDIKNYTDIIGYTPILNEPNYHTAHLFSSWKGTFHTIPPQPQNDPFHYAEHYLKLLEHQRVTLLIPGRVFDSYGTRHGRGGGWYDRFLSRVPREWLRIGVVNHTHFSKEGLPRNPWDEPMDFILIHDSSENSWTVHKVLSQNRNKE